MSHSILLVVPMPDEKNVIACQLWGNLPSIVAKIAKQNKGIQFLGRNVILIDIDKHLSELVGIVYALNDLHYMYTILDEEMSWHEGVNIPQISHSF